MNEAEFQNLQVSDILYLGDSRMPCVVTQSIPSVVVSATAIIGPSNFAEWHKAKSVPTPDPDPVYLLQVQIVKVVPGGAHEEVDVITVLEDFNGQDSASEYANRMVDNARL